MPAVGLQVAAQAVAQETTSDLAVGTLLIGLFGGLALFLFGMEKMSTSLKAVAGERMKSTLARLTDNRFMGVITGPA